jgi:Leucine-rich repeat (LRR) protein
VIGLWTTRKVISFHSVFQVIGFLENLILLDISMNKLETLPPEIESMKSLTDLYLSENELLELPENIGKLFSY